MIIEIHGLSKNYGNTQVLANVELGVRSGEFHSIIGPNGAGKSTLFNLITGYYRPTSGTIKLRGENIVGLKPFQVTRKGLSRSFQITNIFSSMSVFENIQSSLLWSFGLKHSCWRNLSKLRAINDRAEEILEQIGMAHRREVISGELSYAEQRLLEIGITVSSGAEVILLDEPTAGLSKHETSDIVERIKKICADKTLLLVEHDMSVVFSISDTISVLAYGKIIASGKPEDIKKEKIVQEAYLGSVEQT